MPRLPVYVTDAVKMELGHWACPSCGGKIDGATGLQVGGDPQRMIAPNPGDVSVCGWCGQMLQYAADLRSVQKLPHAEFRKLAPEQRRLMRALSEDVKRNPPPIPKVMGR